MKKKIEKQDTPIVASYGQSSETLHCNKDNANLISTDNGFIHYCPQCGARYMPSQQDVRHGTVQSTMDGPVIDGDVIDANRNPAVSYAPEPTTIKHKKEYKGGIAELAKRSTINIKGYVERKG
jgi:hypothetical protein